MEAVIIAGGSGTRLLPLTEFRPKPLLPVAGVPFVVHQLAKLAAAGIRRVVFATAYRADSFLPVLGDGSAWGLEVEYVTEPEPLGTGGGIRNVSGWLRSQPGEPVVVLNSDILSGHDLRAQLTRHEQAEADVTLHLVEVADARQFGCVPTDSAGNVSAFVEKSANPVSRQVNAGCYVFRREVIDHIPADEVVSVERQTFPQLVAAGARVVGYLEDAYWIDVGTPQALCRASADLVLGVASSPAYLEPVAEHWAAPDAQIAAPASVRGGSSVGPRAVVGPGAGLVASVVFADAVIGVDAVLTNSVVGVGARVGAGALLFDCAIGDAAVVPDGCRPPPGSRLSAGSASS